MSTVSIPCDVTLNWTELMIASHVGCLRRVSSMKQGFKNRHGMEPGNEWQIDMEGACGEMALAKCLGQYWGGSVNTFKMGGDVGDLQVRTTSQHNHSLIVRPDDWEASKFWLVTGMAPSYTVRGWIVGRDAKRDDWLHSYNDRPPAWFVPQASLRRDI